MRYKGEEVEFPKDTDIPDQFWTAMSVGRLALRQRAPYFTSMARSLVVTPVRGIGTWGTSEHLHLYADVDWTLKVYNANNRNKNEELAFLWFHEIMHPFNSHLARRGDRDASIWNIAGDIFINECAKEMGFTHFPGSFEKDGTSIPGGVFADTFGFEKNLTAYQYYELLIKDAITIEVCCGSGSGNNFEDEPGGSEMGGRSESDKKVIIKSAAAALKNHAAQGRGSVPHGLLLQVEELLTPPVISWQDKLQMMVSNAVNYVAGNIDFRFHKMGRRQGGSGYGVGCPITPCMVAPVPRVVFAMDTSGSMTFGNRLPLALREAMGVLEATGAEVLFCAADAGVHELVAVQTTEDILACMKGGGGTDFRPTFEAISKLDDPPDVIIYATDLDGWFPEKKPPEYEVIWLATEAYDVDVPWGEVIHITDAVSDG